MAHNHLIVFVTVGTMHHRFDRLMDWVELWLHDRPRVADVIVQHGTSRVPVGAEGFTMCSQSDLLAVMRYSDVIVTQGGPGGIADSLDSGILPIVVPRRPEYHEHVDDHQVRFCAFMAQEGLIRLAETEAEFRIALDDAVSDPDKLRVSREHTDVAATVARMGQLIDELVLRKPPRQRRRGLFRLVGVDRVGSVAIPREHRSP